MQCFLNLSLFHRENSIINWYEMVCTEKALRISTRIKSTNVLAMYALRISTRIKSTNVLAMYAQYGVRSLFHRRIII